jgi:hypothetical protein
MALMNSLTRRLIDAIKGKVATATPTSTDLNKSPRFIDINKPREVKFSDASAKGTATPIMLKAKGGEVLSKGNKLARMQKTKLY